MNNHVNNVGGVPQLCVRTYTLNLVHTVQAYSVCYVVVASGLSLRSIGLNRISMMFEKTDRGWLHVHVACTYTWLRARRARITFKDMQYPGTGQAVKLRA